MQRCILSGAPHNTLWKELNSVDDICLFILGILTACHCLPLVLSLFLCVILWRVSAKVWDNYRCQSNSVISQSTFCMDRIPRWALPNSKLLTTSYLLKNSTMHNHLYVPTYHQRIRSNKQKQKIVFTFTAHRGLGILIHYLYSITQCDLPPLRPHCGEAPRAEIRTRDGRSTKYDDIAHL